MGLRPCTIVFGLWQIRVHPNFATVRVQCTELNGTNGGCVAWLVRNGSQTMDYRNLVFGRFDIEIAWKLLQISL